jgi:hypothetical protein
MLLSDEFLKPRLNGKRFDDHTIPLELLEDFAALEELFIEVAKWIYLNENTDRKRVPRGFTDGVALKLSSIEAGSAVPKILLVTSSLGLFPNDNQQYFEKAKENILLAIDAAGKEEEVTKFIPENLLVYFNRIGKRLKDDETIDFSPDSGLHAKLNKTTRKRLVLASSNINEVTNETTIRGSIPEVDKSKKTFTVLTINGQRINAKLQEPHSATVFEAFNSYESKSRVLISGVGRFDKNDKLVSIESIEHISILDPLDIPSRLEELSNLENGWLNGEGTGMKKENVTWFADIFETNYNPALPLPYLYPTPSGGIQAEWSFENWDISLNIDLNDKSGFYQSLQLDSDDVIEARFDLTKDNDWQVLNQKLADIFKV